MSKARLSTQLLRWDALGVRYISLDAYLERLRTRAVSSVPEFLLTFDHPTVEFVDLLWPELAARSIAPVLFVTTGAVGRRRRTLLPFGPHPPENLSWGELASLERAGASVQCHGHTGCSLTRLPLEIAFGDLMRARREVETRLGSVPCALSYPGGAVDDAVADLAAKAGFLAGFTRRSRAMTRGPDDRPAWLQLPRQGWQQALGPLAREGAVGGVRASATER